MTLALDPPGVGPSTPVAAAPVTLEEEPPPLASQAAAFAAAWNVAVGNGWRAPFYRTILGPGSAPITLLRGIEGTGQLMRAGAPPRIVRIPITSTPATWPATLALHPTGTEGYVVAWPTSLVRAFDPVTLESRWTLPVEGAAQGLFVDAGGRFLLLETGPPGTDRLLDWAIPAVEPAPVIDPARDEALRAQERPPAEHTVVVDLAAHDVGFRASGRFRRWTAVDDASWICATDREVVWYTPAPPEP